MSVDVTGSWKWSTRGLRVAWQVRKEPSLLSTLAEVREQLHPLELLIARDANRDIHEGRFHDGPSATVQLVGIRPA